MVNFLATCVQHFTSQEYVSSGCSLRSLLDWAWSRVGFIKESLDRLCEYRIHPCISRTQA